MNIREEYLKFFQEKGHKIMPSASLIAENDPSLLFVNSGMFPLVPYLLGQKHPSGSRLCNSQKCFRSEDLDEVGDNRHTTFFEMLGNWSFNDYSKKDQLNWWWEFLIERLKIDPSRLVQTIYQDDSEAHQIMKDIFAKYEIEPRIFFGDKDTNWWQRGDVVGELGGTDSDTFFDTQSTDHLGCHPNCECGRFIEIGNSVFMEFIMTKDGWKKIDQKNIDFGGGLERLSIAINDVDNIFETEFFVPIMQAIKDNSSQLNEKAFRVIADHIKACTFLIGDQRGIAPSNTGQGYVVRRLLRRAIRYGRLINLNSLVNLVDSVVGIYDNYSELSDNISFIKNEIQKEEDKFLVMLERGLKEFHKMDKIDAFYLYQTHGFPLEMTQELASEKGLKVDVDEFNKEMNKHREMSRTAAAGTFKGGLADQSEATTKLHTVTHLLLAGLRLFLGDHVTQRGSNITAERIRFDFSHPEKISAETLQKIEDWVNEQIDKNLEVVREDMPVEKAKELGAVATFNEKYPDIVSVYSLLDGQKVVSREICGGPHIENTADLGRFKIIKQESPGAGMRRIKAVLEGKG